MQETWESLFTREAKEKHSEEYIQACLLYGQNLHQHNVPVIFDNVHLSEYFEMSHNRLNNILQNYSKYYSEYDIKKKAGGKRHLSVPKGIIKKMQKWVYESILLPSYTPAPCVHGFIRKTERGTRSIVTNAQTHACQPYLLNVDIMHFFDSISRTKVKDIFLQLGYTDEVSSSLSIICTYKNRLPQGAPTSPIISNYVVTQMDYELSDIAESNNCRYTRYADDLTFSSSAPITIFSMVKEIVEKYQFSLNEKKTKLSRRSQKQEVTGLTINNGVHVPKKYRHDIWRELHFCEKHGVVPHIAHINQRNGTCRGLYKQWLLGRIMYVRSVDKECGQRMLEEFNKLDWIF